jgi:predicted RND superfamily exporter protein
VIALAVLLALVGVIGASSLKPNGEADTLVDKGSDTFRATEDFKEKFGDDAVVVLVRGDLEELVLTPDLQRLLLLEGCLAGNAPPDNLTERVPTPEVCNQLAESKPARVVYGPATVLNQFANQLRTVYEEQAQEAVTRSREAAVAAYRRALKQGLGRDEAQRAAEAAEQSVIQAFTAQAQELATRYGQTGLPSLTSPTFLSSVVFDSRFADGTPKSRFSYLFPSNRSALVSIRLRPDLSESERAEAIDLIRTAVGEEAFRLRSGSYLVSGVPVVVDGLTDELKSEIFVLLIAALVVMALVLALVFMPPLRLLPLLIGLVASAIAFGALALFGGTLTMASIAGLPVLIGLAVDYAIQLQARFVEARGRGSSPARAAAEAAARGGPVIGTACLATAAGFLVLLLSPIPMVRSFGLLLVAGIVIAFILALTAGLAVLSLTGGRGDASNRAARLRGRLPGPPAAVSRFTSSARARLARLGPRSLAISIANPGRVIVAATVLALAGWVAGTRTEIISDFRELVPRDLPELKNVDVLQDETGVSGFVDVSVSADDLTDPEVVSWMGDFRERVLALGAFEGESASCRDDGVRICPGGPSLPELFGSGVPRQEGIRGLLSLLPAYFSQALVETDPETGAIGNTAVLSFGIKVMPFDEQKELIDEVRDEIDPAGSARPPTGVDVEVVGLPVLVADANSKLSSNRYLMTIAGLLAIALVLIAVYRSLKRALVPLIPVVLAPGWSALVLESAGVPLNPMSATLGALVIAIATEFSVLLSARYHEEREAGSSVGEALRLSYSRTGSAVLASGVTAIAGFAVLALAAPIQLLFGGDAIRMLTEFGLVAVVDLLVALAGVLLVLPAVLVGAESDFAAVRSGFARLTRSEARAEA